MLANKIPSLRTERLLLRSLKKTDLDSIKNNISEEVIEFLPKIPWPYTISEAREYYDNSLFKEKSGEEYNWGICLNEELIGTITLSFEFSSKARISFLLNKDYFRRGIMFESVKKVLEYGFGEKKLNKIYTGVVEDNIASVNLLKKCGFSIDGRNRKHLLVKGKYADEIILSLLREEY